MADNIKDIKPTYFDRTKAVDLCYQEVYGSEKASAFNKAVNANYNSFRKYIRLASKAAEDKQEIEADYFVVDRDNDFRLSKYIKVNVLSKVSNGKIIPNDQTVINTLLSLGVEVSEIEINKITVDGKEVSFHKIDDAYVFQGENDSDVLLNDSSEIVFEKDLYTPEFIIYKGNQYPVRKYKASIPNYDGGLCEDSVYSFIKFQIEKDDNEQNPGEKTLELIDNPSLEISVYDIFFGEDATAVFFDDRTKTCPICYQNKETGRIVIKLNELVPSIPNEGKVHLSKNTYQLNCQRNAIEAIVTRPCKSQKPLLDLCLQYDKIREINPFEFQNVRLEYKVLTDSSRSGTLTQRDFVQKSLQTPDFMILQGPPGSGKTTAILELIYQLCKRGKRVLLCASTHVAVDNVLEKIVTHPQSEELLSVINPVRIGKDDAVASDYVKPFVHSNVKSGVNAEYEEILNESFNLVCGTIVGVLQFPPIKSKVADIRDASIESMFDYLILDEASKTTFSEFLVPAILCKRWIIVGDVKQLAPYVEKNDLIPSLLECEPLKKKEDRLAINLLMRINDPEKRKDLYEHAYILPTSSIKYIDERAKIKDRIIAVSNQYLQNIERVSLYDFQNKTPNLACLSANGNIVLIDSSFVDRTIPYLNSQITVLDPDVNISADILFDKYQVLKFRGNFKKDYYKEFDKYSSKKLEGEILWRLIRLYELKNDENATKGYNDFFKRVRDCLTEEELANFNATIDMLRNIAIPSVIMILQEGVDRNNRISNRLTCGFTKEEKANRFVRLEYQHRMHPHISKISRENVYFGEALLDSNQWTSKMSYLNDKSKFEIRNVSGQIVDGHNRNEKEVYAIMKELEDFIEYAKTHQKSDGKKYDIAILSFYNPQVSLFRKLLKERFKSNSNYNYFIDNIHVTVNTVDKFQGQEADIVYISMVQNQKVGFLDSVNRVNVAITRAKEKVIIFGDKDFFANKQDHSTLLKKVFKEAN